MARGQPVESAIPYLSSRETQCKQSSPCKACPRRMRQGIPR
ncbi:Uncharacterised protein [Bordetella pertussis]|nr:Uncharacterised protein [Bordetella pertussis]